MGLARSLTALLGRPRRIVAGALALIISLGWLCLVMTPMPMPASGVAGNWTANYLAWSLAMWFVMMVAMMTPAVSPVILLYDRVMHGDKPGWHGRTLGFLVGYLLAWGLFSAAATLAQALMLEAGFIDAMGMASSRRSAALVLLAVALYQFSAAKAACLERCHSPLGFIVRRRRGPIRGVRAGLSHGAWCIGCCGVLMLLLFVGGVMNLAWVAGITVAVTLEKLTPDPKRVRIAIGIGALLGAGWLASTGMLESGH
ncbi:MAG: DUF2182 domain-containing protein [Gammaproteobacteria bacterium]